MARAAGVFAVGVEGGFPNAEALPERRAPDLLARRDLTDAVGVPSGAPSESRPPDP